MTLEPNVKLALLAAVVAVFAVADWALAVRRGNLARRRQRRVIEPPDTWPSVSVIVPAWTERGTLEPCLDALAAVDYPTWELLVVAGGDDDTLGVAREACRDIPWATVIEQPPGGKPAALDAGLALATGDVIVVLDADSRVRPDWLRRLIAPLGAAGAPRIRATTGRPEPSRSTAVTRVEELERVSAYDVRQRIVLQGSGSIAIERSALQAIGGFAADAYADDWELDARLALHRQVRAYCPDAIVVTERPATLGEYWSNEVRWRRAHLRSLTRVAAYFLASPELALTNLYPYAAAWFLLLVTAIAIGALAFGAVDLALRSAALFLIGAAAILAHRVALVVEVVAYRRESSWLREIPALIGLFVLTLVACVIASLSLGRATLRFKGPRAAHRKAGT